MPFYPHILLNTWKVLIGARAPIVDPFGIVQLLLLQNESHF